MGIHRKELSSNALGLTVLSKNGFGKRTPIQYMLQRINEVVSPFVVDVKIKGPMLVPASTTNNEEWMYGYLLTARGKMTTSPTMMIHVDDMKEVKSVRAIAEVFGGIIHDRNHEKETFK
jgi:hypothetical protein